MEPRILFEDRIRGHASFQLAVRIVDAEFDREDCALPAVNGLNVARGEFGPYRSARVPRP